MKSEIVSHSIRLNWLHLGEVTNGQTEFTLSFPSGVPTSAGIYRILAPTTAKVYVGESNDLARRLNRDYAHAGWEPGRNVRTNRRVQKWIYETLISRDSTVEVATCTEAFIVDSNRREHPIDLTDKYNRIMLEGLTLGGQPPNISRINL